MAEKNLQEGSGLGMKCSSRSSKTSQNRELLFKPAIEGLAPVQKASPSPTTTTSEKEQGAEYMTVPLKSHRGLHSSAAMENRETSFSKLSSFFSSF